MLNLYQTQYTQTDKLWGYFGTVSLAVLAFTLGSEKATKSVKEALTIIAGYIIFCFGNYSALTKAQEQLDVFADHAMKVADKVGIPINNLSPFEINDVCIFYWGVVTAVSVGIGLITKWRST